MTQLLLQTSSGFTDPTDVQIKGSGGWSTVNTVHVFTPSGWTEVWPLTGGGTGGTFTCYGYIEVLFLPPGGGVYDDIYYSDTVPSVDISSIDPYPSGYQYIDLTIDIEYDDPDYTGGTTPITNHPADYYIRDVNTSTVYNLGNLNLGAWYDPSLSIKTAFVTNALDLYNITGSGTFVFYVTTTINGTLYTYENPQQLTL